MEKPTPDAQRVRLRLTLGAGVVLVLVAAVIAVLVVALAPHGVTGAVARPGVVNSATPAAAAPRVYVHVVGAVREPGLYELPGGDRVIDAVAAAGGFTPAADQAQVNLARVLADGEQLVIPKKGQVQAAPGATSTGKVNLNTADAAALETLDGIGPALAQRILDYRAAKGGFTSVSDLQKVAGIGDRKFALIKDHVST